MNRFLPFFTLLISIISLTGCGQSTSEKLVLTGSSTVAPLVSEIALRYESQHPGIRIDVQTGGSSRGVNDTRSGLADIGMVSRSLKASEEGLSANIIAWDGITLILHQDNPVTALTRQQVIDIFTGKVQNWREVGGKNEAIVVVNKAEGRSTLELFLKHFGLKNSEVDADIVIGDNQQGLKTVAGNPLAIGYVSIGAAAYEFEHGAPINLLAINGVEATLANVEKGVFPIARPLNLIIKDSDSKLAADFIAFAQSSKVNDLILNQYFIPANAN